MRALLAALALTASPAWPAGKPAPAMPGQNVPAVKVNTVGFPSRWPKTAIVNFEPEFRVGVLWSPDGTWRPDPFGFALDKGAFKDLGVDKASQDQAWQVDISGLGWSLDHAEKFKLAFYPRTPGAWRASPGAKLLSDGGVAFESDPFVIGPSPYKAALKAALKMFYYQRTRTLLQVRSTQWDQEDDDYSRAGVSHDHGDVGWLLQDHPHKRTRWKPEKGWHDAGNFDIYVPSLAPSCQLLLFAFEFGGRPLFGDDLGIPESGNDIPDILDEAAWGLDWLASMQTSDGSFRAREAVYKVGGAPEGPADRDQSVRWVSGVGSASTAKACAALAQAARVYRAVDRARADGYERCARKAWAWLLAHPEKVAVDGRGSDQPLWDDDAAHKAEAGCRASAAVQVFLLTGEEAPWKALLGWWNDPQLAPGRDTGSWENIGRFTWLALLLGRDPGVKVKGKARPQPSGFAGLQLEARRRIAACAELWKDQVERQDGYRCALAPGEYYWGTPSNLCERLQLMHLAAKYDPKLGAMAWAADAARDQWHWILGRNPNGYSLVTRVGKGPERIYHMEWGKKRVPPPGFMVSGPNGKDAAFLAPGAPAKALLWDNPMPLTASKLAPHSLWHNRQEDLWEGGFLKPDQWDVGWWVVSEVDIYYNANLVLAGAMMQD